LPWEEVKENIYRKVVMGDRMMMVLYRFDAPQEQGGYIIKGKILLRLPEEGQEMVLGPGDGYLIESYKRHSWRVLDEEVVLVDFFSPPRKELMKEKFAPDAVNR
jgi:quercetin dioxygenase-like cupin family protein